MPDTPATGSSTPVSPLTVAQALEGAADQLLIHGRCRTDLEGPAGEMCVMKAISNAVSVAGEPRWILYQETCAALNVHLVHESGVGIVDWNEKTENDDEVRDALLLLAKDLRNEARPS